MCNRLDNILAYDGQTDGQTSCHGIVRAMHTRRAVKIVCSTACAGIYATVRICLSLSFRR